MTPNIVLRCSGRFWTSPDVHSGSIADDDVDLNQHDNKSCGKIVAALFGFQLAVNP
jgi:hypothetical protein